jgi:signal transduction histidine kinase
VRYLLVAVLTDEADQMGIRMGPIVERRVVAPDEPGRSTDQSRTPLLPPWLSRLDLLILPLVFVIDTLLFSRLLRADFIPAGRVAIVCYSAVGVCLLIFRRLAPVLVFCAAWVHGVLALLITDAYFPVLILLVALEAVAELRSIRVSLAALAAALVPSALMVGAAVREASDEGKVTAAVGSALFYLLIDVLAWAIGRWAGRHRNRLLALEREHTLEVAEQRLQAENAVSAERLRIARELHDIVAHSVTIMVLHAAGAKRVVDTDPAMAKESLSTIEESGQQAMGELRRLLELLRETEGEFPRSGSPLPGLVQLEQVVNSVRGSGVAVVLEIIGEPRKLDTSIDLAAYRLVQEALTNVTKHRGAGAHVTVSIEWADDKMTVAVEDDGRGAPGLTPALSTGNGLAGLRERVAVAGGDFAAGPTESGGFRVAARLPVSALPGGTVQDRSADSASATAASGDEHPSGTTMARVDP